MCLVIDINSLTSVFIPKDSGYREFKYIREWIINGDGKIVFGGSKYKNELNRLHKIRKLFVELNRMHKIIHGNDEEIDEYENKIKLTINHPDFDDPHIVAIIAITGCLIVCTKDNRAIPYIKNKNLYPAHIKRPKVYTSSRNKNLLAKKYIAKICK